MKKISIKGEKNTFLLIFEAISTVIDEGTIYFEKEKLYTRGMNDSHTIFLKLEVNPKIFKEYNNESPNELQISLNFKSIKSILDKCENEVIMIFGDEIVVSSQNKFYIEAHIPQMSSESELIKMPEYKYSSELYIKSEDLKKIKEILDFSEFIELNVSDKLTVKVIGAAGEIIKIGITPESNSKMDRKDDSIRINGDFLRNILNIFDSSYLLKLNLDKSKNTIEIIYEKELIYIKFMISVENNEET